MPKLESAFDCLNTARRLAKAETLSELETAWIDAEAAFQKSWEYPRHAVITLVHDAYGNIDDDDVARVLTKISSLEKRQPVDIILHTHGGYAPSTLQIASVIVKRSRTRAFIPIFAKSGGTIIALSTEEIHLGSGATLSPADLQYGSVPARDVILITEQLGNDAPPGWRAAAIDAKRLIKDETKKVCAAINIRHKGFWGWDGCKLANTLTANDMHHGEAITLRKARRLHINAISKVPKSVYAIVSLRLEQLKRLRELEAQVNLVQRAAS